MSEETTEKLVPRFTADRRGIEWVAGEPDGFELLAGVLRDFQVRLAKLEGEQ